MEEDILNYSFLVGHPVYLFSKIFQTTTEGEEKMKKERN